jgi:integrase
VPRRSDIDLDGRAVRVQVADSVRYSGELVLGPPKSRAGRRIVGIPNAIFPVLRNHLASFAKPGADGLVFPGPKGSPLRRNNFNKMSAWPPAVRAIGAEGLHFHDYADVRVMPTRAGESLAAGLPARFMSA